jgi:hypothetical protein
MAAMAYSGFEKVELLGSRLVTVEWDGYFSMLCGFLLISVYLGNGDDDPRPLLETALDLSLTGLILPGP